MNSTFNTPKIGDFSLLKVVAVENLGAFLEWTGDKDLLLPTSEQTEEVYAGDEILIYVFLDKSERPCASMRLEKFLEKTSQLFTENQEVDLWIYRKTDLGYKAIVNGNTMGVLYSSNVFKPLSYAQKLKGFVGKLRPDGKIDLTLSKTGHDSAADIEPVLLKMLEEQNGFLPLNDKATPETIYSLFGVSKKKYKMVLGGLYKRKLITVSNDGIRLAAPLKTT